MRFEFDEDGVLHQVFDDPMHKDWREAICPVCGERIAWCLDIMSFTTGPDHRLAHARCVWIREAFTTEGRKAPVDHYAVSPRDVR